VDGAVSVLFRSPTRQLQTAERAAMILRPERRAMARNDRRSPFPDSDSEILTASPAAQLLDELALYRYRPLPDEPDPRPLPEPGDVRAQLDNAVEAFGAMLTGTLADLLWPFVNLLHRKLDRIERELDLNEQAQRRAHTEQDGSEVKSVELDRALDQSGHQPDRTPQRLRIRPRPCRRTLRGRDRFRLASAHRIDGQSPVAHRLDDCLAMRAPAGASTSVSARRRAAMNSRLSIAPATAALPARNGVASGAATACRRSRRTDRCGNRLWRSARGQRPSTSFFKEQSAKLAVPKARHRDCAGATATGSGYQRTCGLSPKPLTRTDVDSRRFLIVRLPGFDCGYNAVKPSRKLGFRLRECRDRGKNFCKIFLQAQL
jgi:hypothetical protein